MSAIGRNAEIKTDTKKVGFFCFPPCKPPLAFAIICGVRAREVLPDNNKDKERTRQ